MTLIRGRKQHCREHISKISSPIPESNHDKAPVDPSIDPSTFSVVKYTEENLQKILRTVLKARAPPSNGCHKKPLKARSFDVYHGKFYIECYNFCQQCEDHFIIIGPKGPNRIFFTSAFLHDRINFRWQQYKRKHEAKSTVLITLEEFKNFFCWSLRNSQAFVNSYWVKIKIDSYYQQENVLDWATHLEHLQAVLREFDAVAALNEDIIIRYFWESLWPFIQV